MSSIGIVNHSMTSVFTLRTLKNTGASHSQALERMNSGQRVNSASDDAAGLTVSEKMRAQLHGLDQARRNTQDGISMIQTAEGGMSQIQTIVHRLRILAVQAASDTYTTFDRQRMQTEVNELVRQIDFIADSTEFNTKKLLNGNTMGLATSSNSQVASAYITGEVISADYSITVLDAGTACNIHGGRNIGLGDDGKVNLKAAGIRKRSELQIRIDGMERVIFVDPEDALEDLALKINRANMGVVAGLDKEGNDLTITSARSGSRFNISFGEDPDGVALALGLFGGQDGAKTMGKNAHDAQGADTGHSLFTSGTDTIISITNVSVQSLQPTDPGFPDSEGGYSQSLGIFRSNCDIFTEKELMNPINKRDLFDENGNLAGKTPDWPTVNNSNRGVILDSSALLKGLVIHIDEQLDHGLLQQGDDDDLGALNPSSPDSWTAFFPDPFSGGDYFSRGQVDHRAKVPDEKVTGLVPNGANSQEIANILTTHISIRSATQTYQIGANSGQSLKAYYGNLRAECLGLAVGLPANGEVYDGKSKTIQQRKTEDLSLCISLETRKSASDSLVIINDALQNVSSTRSRLGSVQNSLEKTADYLNIAYEEGPQSKIRDANMAKEAVNLARESILMQSGVAMLGQANITSQSVLSLLR